MTEIKTPDAIRLLHSRHPQAQGKWANIVEFCNIDFVAVGAWHSTRYAVHGYEIKVSRGDWLKELKKPDKADAGMARCDFWYLAAPAGVMKPHELPLNWGYVQLNNRGSRVITPAVRLRPEAPASQWDNDEDGKVIINREFYDREAFAMLARRYAYSQADREALLSIGTDEERKAALDKGARATGRMDSDTRDLQRHYAVLEKERRKQEKVHRAHVVAGAEYDKNCTYGWCAHAAAEHPELLGKRDPR